MLQRASFTVWKLHLDKLDFDIMILWDKEISVKATEDPHLTSEKLWVAPAILIRVLFSEDASTGHSFCGGWDRGDTLLLFLGSRDGTEGRFQAAHLILS